MSPRTASASASPSSTRSANAPYARRTGSQPKSSRQQFSACGACRMRRVRCDLKDLPINSVGPHPSCSNCKERGIKCVDEFADVKAVKLLRRGRRLQQVEAIYGKINEHDGSSSSSATRLSTSVPTLQLDFFASPFWSWFIVQRPLLDSVEFPARYAAHCKGTQPLGNEATLVAMTLVAWAASFGLDERGAPIVDEQSPPDAEMTSGRDDFFAGDERSKLHGRRRWKAKCEVYLRDILELVDYYAVLRRPSLDGVRALLLLLPLMEEAQPLERLAIHGAALSQVQALCVISHSSPTGFEDACVRARIFWYAYTQEAMTTGLRGGRLTLDSDDLDAFQRTLPPLGFGVNSPPLPSPSSPSFLNMNLQRLNYQLESGQISARELASHKAYLRLISAFSLPLTIGNVCRKIHAVLTGTKATRRAEDHGLIDANGMREIWCDLDRCWQEFESLKRDHDGNYDDFEAEQCAHGWQIFIFECHNVIRECLKHFMSNPASQTTSSRPSSSHSSNSSPYLSPHHLHAAATRKCLDLLPKVIYILRHQLSKERNEMSGIFRWDVGLIRDGCFFAGYISATMASDGVELTGADFKREDGDTMRAHVTGDESVSICLIALAAMRWGFSKSEEREETVRMIWDNRSLRTSDSSSHNPHYDPEYPPSIHMPSTQLTLHSNTQLPVSSLPTTPEDRPMLPPLNLFPSQRRVESAPNTAASTDGRGLNGWPSYTPPGTATSVATSNSTGFSGRGSPVFANLATFKTSSDDIFYQSSGDLDHFSYNVPLPGPVVRENSSLAGSVPGYPPRHSSIDSGTLSAGSTTTPYMTNGSFPSPNPQMVGQADFHTCPQFGENCNGSYH